MGKRKSKSPRKKFFRMAGWTSPNKSVIREYASHVESLQRGSIVPVMQQGTILHQIDRFADVEPAMVMPTRGCQIPEPRDPAPPFVRVLLKRWEGDRHHGISQFHHQKYPHPSGELLLFFSGNEYIWGQLRPDCLRLSLTYIGRGPAWKAYTMDRIQWIMRVPIPTHLIPPVR